MIVRVRHYQAVWETLSFNVEVPPAVVSSGVDVEAWVREHFDELLDQANDEGITDVSQGDAVLSVDPEIEVVTLTP